MLTFLVFVVTFAGVLGLGITKFKSGKFAKVAVGVVALVVALFVSAFTADFYVMVEPGQVAVYRDMFRGVLKDRVDGPGLHFKLPIVQRAKIFITQTQAYTMSVALEEGQRYGDDSLQAKTEDGQDVWVDLTVFFHVEGEQAAQIWQEVGDDYVDKILRPNVRGECRLVISGYSAEGLYQAEKRAEAQTKMDDALRPLLADKGITLERITLRNVNFTDQFSKAIESKQIEAQNIQRAKYELERIIVEKEQKIVQAQGDAESIRLRGEILRANPQVIQYEFVEKMAPNIKWGILPTGSVPLLNLQDLEKAE